VNKNSSFQVVESFYGDAPPIGQWIGLSEVNIIYGKLDQSDNDKTTKRKNDAREMLRNSIGGGKAAFKAAVFMTRRKPLPKEHVNKKGPEGEAKFLVVRDEHECNMMT